MGMKMINLIIKKIGMDDRDLFLKCTDPHILAMRIMEINKELMSERFCVTMFPSEFGTPVYTDTFKRAKRIAKKRKKLNPFNEVCIEDIITGDCWKYIYGMYRTYLKLTYSSQMVSS